MPKWSNTPPPEADHAAFRILRTPADQILEGIVTSNEVLGCPTHYWHNRTIPCEGEADCPACQAGHSWRWHGYLAFVLTPGHEHALFEFTAVASDTFASFHATYGSLRACRFTARRPSNRPNGRVVITCRRLDEHTLGLPQPPDVQRILCHIWGIPTEETDTSSLKRPPHRGLTVQGNGNGTR